MSANDSGEGVPPQPIHGVEVPPLPVDSIELRSVESQIAAMERQLAEVMRALERAQQLAGLGVLAASIAHEVNNILTPIQGYARSALSRPGDSTLTQTALRRAAEGAERGGEIARCILALAGEAAGGACDGCGVAGAAAEAVESATEVLTQNHVRVQLGIEVGLRVAMPRAGVVHVLLNLLVNAGRAMSGRGGIVRIECRAPSGTKELNASNQTIHNTLRTTELVEIVVEDDGPGIPVNVRERLFRAFATASGGGVSSTGGSGLGLSICKALIEASGGSISLQTAVGQGTTFRIVLPRACERTVSAA